MVRTARPCAAAPSLLSRRCVYCFRDIYRQSLFRLFFAMAVLLIVCGCRSSMPEMKSLGNDYQEFLVKNVNLTNASLSEVFGFINHSIEVVYPHECVMPTFALSPDLGYSEISLNVSEISLGDLMNVIADALGIRYTVSGRWIIVIPRKSN